MSKPKLSVYETGETFEQPDYVNDATIALRDANREEAERRRLEAEREYERTERQDEVARSGVPSSRTIRARDRVKLLSTLAAGKWVAAEEAVAQVHELGVAETLTKLEEVARIAVRDALAPTLAEARAEWTAAKKADAERRAQYART